MGKPPHPLRITKSFEAMVGEGERGAVQGVRKKNSRTVWVRASMVCDLKEREEEMRNMILRFTHFRVVCHFFIIIIIIYFSNNIYIFFLKSKCMIDTCYKKWRNRNSFISIFMLCVY